MMFENRENAAKLLLQKLEHYKNKNVIVAGIPRGAMPMAKIIADGLNAKLSAVLVHKLPSPDNVEFAVGSIGLSGHVHHSGYVETYGIPESYMNRIASHELKKLKDRQKKYAMENPDFKNKTVIIVDDGVATGATTVCAIHEVRSYSPRKVVLAVPISSIDAAARLRSLVDEFIPLYLPQRMFSIGEFYKSFPQVTDEEVIEMLHPEIRGEEHHAPL